jgi:hypothetical protein
MAVVHVLFYTYVYHINMTVVMFVSKVPTIKNKVKLIFTQSGDKRLGIYVMYKL